VYATIATTDTTVTTVTAALMLPDNLGYLFDAPLRLAPSSPALIQGDRVLSYQELDARADWVAGGLRGLGVEPGDRVALLFSNDWRFAEVLFGTMRLGAVAVPLNIRMGDEALAYVLSDAEAQVLIANEEQAGRAERLTASAAGIRHLVAPHAAGPGRRDYDAWLAAAPPGFPRASSRPEDVCLMPYTSGSTGKPKGVLLTHAGQVWNADVIRKAIQADDSERALVAVPLYHKNAMIGAVKPFLLAGGAVVVLPGFDPLEVIRAIERYRVTYLTGVPAMYRRILGEREALARHDVSSLRFALCGSAEVPEDLLEEFHRVFGAEMAESYGLTEGGPVPLVNTRWGLKRRGSCGRAFPGCDVKLVGHDGSTEVPVGEVGELVTRNPGLAAGYWKLPQVTARRFRDGWLSTGDLLRRDADGFYYFVGRQDDQMNVGGENVYPKEVEDLLLRHPAVQEVCVVSVPHSEKGEVPWAFVVHRQDLAVSEEELRQFFLKHGAPYAHPRRIVILDALPLGGTGKVDREGLKARARALAEAG